MMSRSRSIIYVNISIHKDITLERDGINFSYGWFTREASVSSDVSLVRLQFAIFSDIASCVTLLEFISVGIDVVTMIPSSDKEFLCEYCCQESLSKLERLRGIQFVTILWTSRVHSDR